VIRLRLAVPLALLVGVLGFGLVHPAAAGAKSAPATPSPSPAPSPTATPEPLDVQIPRLEAAIKANPNDKDSMMLLASDYLAVNRPDLALPLTQHLLQGGTKNAQIYFTDGASQAALGHVTEGIASMEQAADLEPTNMMVLQSLTQLYMRANRPADAERVAKRAITFNTDQEPAYETYGSVLAAEKKFDDARAQFEAAAKLNPKDAHPIVLVARTYEDQNAFALAGQTFDRAIAIEPTSLEALIGKAQLAASQHDVTTAVATYNTILAQQTQDVDKAAVLDEIGKLYATEKQDANADAEFRKAIDSYPSLPGTHIVYGDYLASKGDKAGAQREWTAAVGANRDNPDALARLANLAATNNDLNTAVADFKRVTEVAPQDPRGYLLLGQVYMAQHNWTPARDAFRASFNLQRSPEALVGLAAADAESNNFTEAIQIYEALDKQAPDLMKQHPEILFAMGKAYQGNHQNDKAKATFQRLLALLKPGTPGYNQVKTTIASVDYRPAPAPAAKPKAKTTALKPKPKPSASPSH
jgi:tetratricopeptide (TPR) repeat protein